MGVYDRSTHYSITCYNLSTAQCYWSTQLEETATSIVCLFFIISHNHKINSKVKFWLSSIVDNNTYIKILLINYYFLNLQSAIDKMMCSPTTTIFHSCRKYFGDWMAPRHHGPTCLLPFPLTGHITRVHQGFWEKRGLQPPCRSLLAAAARQRTPVALASRERGEVQRCTLYSALQVNAAEVQARQGRCGRRGGGIQRWSNRRRRPIIGSSVHGSGEAQRGHRPRTRVRTHARTHARLRALVPLWRRVDNCESATAITLRVCWVVHRRCCPLYRPPFANLLIADCYGYGTGFSAG